MGVALAARRPLSFGREVLFRTAPLCCRAGRLYYVTQSTPTRGLITPEEIMKSWRRLAMIFVCGGGVLLLGGCSNTLLNLLWIIPQLTQSLTDLQSVTSTT
jgi:hypothetical protein